MNATASIHGLEEVLADEGCLSQNETYRDPRNPAWTCFDDDKEIDPDLKAFRDDLLDFEEWNADRDFEDNSVVNVGMFKVIRSVRPWDATDSRLEAFIEGNADKSKADWMRSMQLDRVRVPRIAHKLDYYVGGRITPKWWNPLIEHMVNFQTECTTTLQRASNASRKAANTVGLSWDQRRSTITEIAREAIAWNQYLATRLVIKMGMEIGDDSIVPVKSTTPWETVVQSLALSGNQSAAKLGSWIRKHIGGTGPVDGTLFVNPDGSRYKTNGTNPGSAKASFIKRHSLEEAFVSVDRVQYEGQRTSQYVIGVRKDSSKTPSHYYDPAPAWRDFEGGSYAPRACALFMVTPSSVMPTGSHRLTVREFEQALIAGANCYDNADEALAGSIESDFASEGSGYFEENDSDPIDTERLYDGRVPLHGNMGTTGRHESSFTDEESFLMGILRMIGDEHGQELMLLADQEPNMLHRHFFSQGSYDGVVSLLQFVAKTEPEMLEFVTEALCGDEKIAHHMA